MDLKQIGHPDQRHGLAKMYLPSTWSEADADCTTMRIQNIWTDLAPKVPRLVDDDISAIGAWYLADTTSIQSQDTRRDAHRLWGLDFWEMAKADATLFDCVALLTLQKKRTIAATFDKVVYLDHKQKATRVSLTRL